MCYHVLIPFISENAFYKTITKRTKSYKTSAAGIGVAAPGLAPPEQGGSRRTCAAGTGWQWDRASGPASSICWLDHSTMVLRAWWRPKRHDGTKPNVI